MKRQASLFGDDNQLQIINLPKADIRYYPSFINDHQHWFQKLSTSIDWVQSPITVYGKTIPIPRLNAWYGDLDADYSYSGHQLSRNEWTDDLQTLKLKIETTLNSRFNSVLANWYRDGNDSVSWHADDEPELGYQPVIASLSFGETRRFSLKPKANTDIKHGTQHLDLEGGSLLVMAGDTQAYYHHQVAKTRRNVAGRINLTFRTIIQGTAHNDHE